MTAPHAGLVTVRGAELVTGNMTWARHDYRAAELVWYQKFWRYLGPPPLLLGNGEQFVLATRTHWIHLVNAAAQMVVAWPLMILISVMLGLLEDASGLSVWWLLLAGWLAMGAHQVMMLHRIMAWRAQLLVITSHRFIRNSGVFGKKIEDIPLRNITALTVEQKPHQRVLGYGTVRIESGGFHDDGAAREFCHMMCHPEDVVYAANQFPLPLLGRR
jgi:membrane protein YdbS with pleckstrin-like domain